MGSSHTYYGIDPEYITSRSFNAAHVTQSMDINLKILERYKNKWDSLQYLVLSVDYASLFLRLETGEEAWRIKNYNIYYDLPGNSSLKYHTELFSNKLNISVQRFKKYYLKSHYNIGCSSLGWGNNYNSKFSRDLVLTGKLAAKRHYIKDKKEFTRLLNALKSILDFAKAKNIKVILFTAPSYKTYVQQLDSAQLNLSIKTVTELTDSYKDNTIYRNFLTDPSFSAEDYYDADHLNEIGAKKFSIKIDSLLKNFEKL